MAEARDILLHPIRLRIVQALVGNPMTPLRLKEQLGDVAQATLYRHLTQLTDAGFLEVLHERRVRGGVERTYGLVTSASSLTQEELEDATADDHLRYFVTFVGTLVADFAAYLENSDLDLATDRVGYRQSALWLTDSEFDAMVAKIGEAVEEHSSSRPAPGRRRRLLSTIVMPDDRG